MTKKIILLLALLGPFITYFFYTRIIALSKKKYPIKTLSLISVILLAVSLGSLRYYDNYSPSLTKPNVSLKAIDVLLIQLNSLQRNNIPFKDAGIEQVWEFAHPNNKKELDNICEECKNENESVSQNLIMYGYKICESCRTSKTIFPI